MRENLFDRIVDDFDVFFFDLISEKKISYKSIDGRVMFNMTEIIDALGRDHVTITEDYFYKSFKEVVGYSPEPYHFVLETDNQYQTTDLWTTENAARRFINWWTLPF